MLSKTEMKKTNFGKYKFIGTNGINVSEKAKQKFSDSGIKLVYIGRLDIYCKGLDLLIEGIAGCADFLRYNNCILDIYGPDILGRLDRVKTLVDDNNVGDIIKLHGPIFGEEKEKILLESDIFIQTSRSEGMPMGILEALGYGVPCLVTEGTTLSEFVNDNGAGWACPTAADEISLTIKDAISQRENFLNISRNAKEAVCRNFSWESVVKGTVEEYERLIRKQ